ncbi:MAG TPA: iron-sulfur cluster assembly scaffold protein [Candidatus Peribacteraceae bacterium]|nr:iron-sulfur cluster assembly scaffold protein [Candidatus Peribacteraceae bacterium]
MDLYAEEILEHYRHPRCKTRLQSPSVSHEEINHSCGDAMTIDLTLENGTVSAVGWDGTGCAISQACISMMSETIVGKEEDELLALTQKDILDMLAVPIGPRRTKCALLALQAIKNALRIARGDHPQSWSETLAL